MPVGWCHAVPPAQPRPGTPEPHPCLLDLPTRPAGIIRVGSVFSSDMAVLVYTSKRFSLLAWHCLPPKRTCAEDAIDLMKTICCAHMPGVVMVVVNAASQIDDSRADITYLV